MTSTITVNQTSLASFGAPVLAGTKMVKPGSVTLQGNNGTWVTIAADQYLVGLQTGLVRQSTLDDDGAAVDWSTYTSFRATYTVLNAGTETTYTNELVTGTTANDGLFVLTEAAAVPVGADGELIADFLRWVAVNGPVYMTMGYVSGYVIFPAQAVGGSAYARWQNASGEKTGDIISSEDAAQTQGSMSIEGYGPNPTNHFGMVAIAAVDDDGTTSAINVGSDGDLRFKMLNNANIGWVPNFYAKDNTGGVTVQNTVTQTTIFSASIKANSLGANGVLQLIMGGDFQANATNNITFRVKFGGTTLATMTLAVSSAWGSGTGGYIVKCFLVNSNATNDQHCNSEVLAAIATHNQIGCDYGTSAIDTTADKDLIVTAQWDTADTSCGVFSKGGMVLLAHGR